jgi:DNA-binding transcriptional ArsR family regulator
VRRGGAIRPVRLGLVALYSKSCISHNSHVDEVDLLQAEILKALGNPRRLEIFKYLCNGPAEVGTLVEQLGLSQSGASQHLAVLRAAGLVERERNGSGVRYRLSDPDYVQACRIMRAAIQRRLARLAEVSAETFGGAAPLQKGN